MAREQDRPGVGAERLERCPIEYKRPPAIRISALANQRHRPLGVAPELGDPVVVDARAFHQTGSHLHSSLVWTHLIPAREQTRPDPHAIGQHDCDCSPRRSSRCETTTELGVGLLGLWECLADDVRGAAVDAMDSRPR